MSNKTKEKLAEDRAWDAAYVKYPKPSGLDYYQTVRAGYMQGHRDCYLGLQDQGVGVERIMEVKEGPSVDQIMTVVNIWLAVTGDDIGLMSAENDLKGRLSALFTQTQVEPVAWSDRDIDVAYLMGVINGASHEANGKTPWPSLDRVVQELERTKGQSEMIRDAVRSFKVPAKAIAADTPQAEGRGVEAESAVLEEHSPQQTQEGMGLPDGKWIPAKTGLKLDEEILTAIHALNTAKLYCNKGGVAEVNISNADKALQRARNITLDLYDATT